MIGFELKRFVKNKELLMVIVSIIVIIISNTILEIVYYKGNIGKNMQIGNLYNSFSQFMFLVFAPMLGGLISNDFENNSIYFYSNNGINIKKYYVNRVATFILMLMAILTALFFVYTILFKLPIYKSFIVFLLILIDFVFLVFVSGILSLIFRKKGRTAMMIIFTWFLMSVINVIPLSVFKGKLFLVDMNSYTSYIVSNFLGLKGTNINFTTAKDITNTDLFNVFGIGIMWIIICIIITDFLLSKKKIQANSFNS